MDYLMFQNTNLIPINDFDSYLQRVQKIPMLTKDEELELAYDWQQNGNLKSAQRLVLSHLKYVAKIAKDYMGYGLPLNDLVQEGTIGLMKAVKKFDPEVGVRLVSFAVYWIKSEINEFIIKNWRIVKAATTKAKRKVFFNLRKQRKHLGWMSKKEVNNMANNLDVPAAEIMLVERHLNLQDAPFDKPFKSSTKQNEDDNNLSPSTTIAANNADPAEIALNQQWKCNINKKLAAAIVRLDERSKDIVIRRWFEEQKATLQELSLRYGVSMERIRQIEKKALMFLKEQLVC